MNTQETPKDEQARNFVLRPGSRGLIMLDIGHFPDMEIYREPAYKTAMNWRDLHGWISGLRKSWSLCRKS